MDKKVLWLLNDEVARQVDCRQDFAENVISLLEENSVPFIARYRKHLTGGMEPEKIREIKEKVEELKKVETEALKAIKYLDDTKEDLELQTSILKMTNLALLKDMTSSLKPEAKTSKLKAALMMEGLEEAASKLLKHTSVDIRRLVRSTETGLSTHEEVLANLSLVLADKISRDGEVMNFIIQKSEDTSKAYVVSKKTTIKKIISDVDVNKFQEFFNARILLSAIRPHKYLAMRRGENLGILKTGLELNESIEGDFMRTFERRFVVASSPTTTNTAAEEILWRSLKSSYDRHVRPKIASKFRNDLKKTSELAAIDSFCTNLKCLLMTPPVRNKHILGVDPGYKNGCKFALIGPLGDALDTGVVYLANIARLTPASEVNKLTTVLRKHSCEVVAIGDGTGCRETEEFFSRHIGLGTFKPLNVVFSIVQENGASVYSASNLAKAELPNLDVTLRGAVSIARRLQDPLNELIKIDPKNLGVGMYQHDISEAKLRTSLEGVTEDCVSLVGVDVNICNAVTLQHVAGIGPCMAKNIIALREERGVFKNRKQLLDVSLMGKKKFQQCAGFLRINLPDAVEKPAAAVPSKLNFHNLKRKLTSHDHSGLKHKRVKYADSDDVEVNFFDRTAVHPESYEIASKLLEKAKLSSSDIGQESFMKSLLKFVTDRGVLQLSTTLKTSVETLEQIVESLTKHLDEDIRNNYSQPLFRSFITEMKDIRMNQDLTGRVTNVTDFGAFVDVGVEHAGLIHVSGMGSSTHLELGMRVLVRVLNVDVARKRIGLQFLRTL